MKTERHYQFKSDFFQIIDEEDEKTNPGIFGKTLSEWIYKNLQLIKEYKNIEEPNTEDWGWYLECKSTPFVLAIGWHGISDDKKNVDWQIIITSEVNIFKKIFINKSLNELIEYEVNKLDLHLKKMFSEIDVTL